MKKIDLVKLVEEVDKEEMIEGGVHKIFALTCLYKFIEMQEEAINYTHSCTELKDKEAPSFRDWLMVNCEPTRNTNLFKKGNKLLLNTELLEMYKKEYSL